MIGPTPGWDTLTSPLAWTAFAAGAGIVLGFVGLVVAVRRRRDHRPAGRAGRWLLVSIAIGAAIGVAIVGGVRSFEAVSERFGSPLVPLTADGMIVACTALRIAALTRGWRIPGALVTTYGFIAGTVWLNVAAAHDWSDAVAHALAPVSYAILVEMLAHLLRLHLHLATPARRRLAALAWATSPVVSTRVWLHLARTGGDDPIAARALVQQLLRLSSRLRMVCPSSRPWPFGQARQARNAALQIVRDGLLTAGQLADLLPTDGTRLSPAVLVAKVDQAALRCTAPTRTSAPTSRTDQQSGTRTSAPHHPRTNAPADPHRSAGNGARGRTSVNGGRSRRSPTSPEDRTDAELVAELRRIGGPMSGRQVRRVVGVGTSRAKRLVEMAGWATPTAHQSASNGERVNGTQPEQPTSGEDAETKPTDPSEARQNP